MGERKKSRILVIGMGQIGYSNAEYMASQGLDVDGYDLNKKAVARAIDEGIIAEEAEDFRGYEYYIICISTHSQENMFKPSMEGLYDVAHRISREGKNNALVAIESTVTRGASNNVNEILGHRLHVSHFPHRFYWKEKDEHGVRQNRVLGGCEPCCTAMAMRFYETILGIPVHVVSSVEYAELSKIIENSYRFLDIAFAEELKMVCNEYGLSFEELRTAINTKWNVEVLEALSGIGGHCLPKDSQMYLDMAKSVVTDSLLETAKIIDSEYRLHIGLNSEKIQLSLDSVSPEQEGGQVEGKLKVPLAQKPVEE